MPSLNEKACVHRRNIFTVFSIICGFRHPLGGWILEHTHLDKGYYCIYCFFLFINTNDKV